MTVTPDPLLFKIEEHRECPTCGGYCVKVGKRYTNFGEVQKYRCKICGTTHSDGSGRYPEVVKEYAKKLYKSGLSLRGVAEKIKEDLSIVLTPQAVLKWLVKANIPRRQPRLRTKKERTQVQKCLLQLCINIQLRFTVGHEDSTPLIVTEFTDIINICDPLEEV